MGVSAGPPASWCVASLGKADSANVGTQANWIQTLLQGTVAFLPPLSLS